MRFMYDGEFPPQIGGESSLVVGSTPIKECGFYDACTSPNRSVTNCRSGTGFNHLYSLGCGGPAETEQRIWAQMRPAGTNPRIWIVADQNPGVEL